MAGKTIGGGYMTCKDKGRIAAVKAQAARDDARSRAAAERAHAAASWWRPKRKEGGECPST